MSARDDRAFHVQRVGETVSVTAPCFVTGEMYSVTVRATAWQRYQDGVHVQVAFPDLSAPDREFLTSRTSPAGWVALFGPEEEDR